MKKLLVISAVWCSLQLFIGKNWDGGNCYAQGSWTQRADFGGTTRDQAVGFSIGNKGYIGTGYQNAGNTKDFWQWDQALDAWTQMADFGGTARSAAVGFSIGDKGYIGTGFDILFDFKKDFWEWDQLTNHWTQKADFGGTARLYSVGFSIGTNGYIGTGNQTPDFTTVKDFWQWNQITDTWTQIADFGGGLRVHAAAFTIGNKGYVGTGYSNLAPMKDFWEFNPLTNTWTQKANVGTHERYFAVGFSIGTRGYIGTGTTSPAFLFTHDLLEWDQATDTWTEQAPLEGEPRIFSVGFSIGDKGYIGTGLDTGYITHNDFWEFSPDSFITPTCGVPTGENSTHTFNTATLNWDVVPGAISYKLRYKSASATSWTKITSFTNTKKITGLFHGTNYAWQVRSVCGFGNSAFCLTQTFFTGPFKLSDEQAISFDVFPDPFESSTTVSFSLPQNSGVQLELYDVAGRKVQTVLDDNVDAGNHTVTLNRDQLSAGLYFLKMRMNDPDEAGQVKVITKKVMIVQ